MNKSDSSACGSMTAQVHRLHYKESSNFHDTKALWTYFYWINKRKKRNNKWIISGMSTSRPQNLQLLLCPRTLLITDITKTTTIYRRGDSFRENIETLVSYNIRNYSSQQDCLYIEQGHLMTPTTFMTYSMVIDPRKSVVVTWTPIRMYSTPQQGFQPSSLPGSPLYTSS